MKFLGQGFQKLDHAQDRQTDTGIHNTERQTDSTAHITVRIGDNNCIIFARRF